MYSPGTKIIDEELGKGTVLDYWRDESHQKNYYKIVVGGEIYWRFEECISVQKNG